MGDRFELGDPNEPRQNGVKDHPPILEKLRLAVGAEAQLARERERRYKYLTAKILNYQVGKNDSPTSDEFNTWRTDGETLIALRKLHSGVVGTSFAYRGRIVVCAATLKP